MDIAQPKGCNAALIEFGHVVLVRLKGANERTDLLESPDTAWPFADEADLNGGQQRPLVEGATRERDWVLCGLIVIGGFDPES